MSKNTAPRIEVGKSDNGYVFIHEFGNQSETRFEVRCGNLTIIRTPDKARALRVANALADIPDEIGGDGLPPQTEGVALETHATVGPEGLKAGTRRVKKAK